MKVLKEDGEGYYIALTMQQPLQDETEGVPEQIKRVL